MTDKFGGLAAATAEAFRVEIIDAATDKPIRDANGEVAWIEVYPADGELGRRFDKEERAAAFRRARRSRAGTDDGPDQLELNAAKCAALTKAWRLVDPTTLQPLEVACTPDNAKELYTKTGMNWLFVQVWVAANEPANFMQRSATS